MASAYSKIERYKDFIKYFIEKYKPRCCFCGELLDWKTFYPKFGTERDEITKHHKDENRDNNDNTNFDLAHRKCHRKYHKEKERIANIKEQIEESRRIYNEKKNKFALMVV